MVGVVRTVTTIQMIEGVTITETLDAMTGIEVISTASIDPEVIMVVTGGMKGITMRDMEVVTVNRMGGDGMITITGIGLNMSNHKTGTISTWALPRIQVLVLARNDPIQTFTTAQVSLLKKGRSRPR